MSGAVGEGSRERWFNSNNDSERREAGLLYWRLMNVDACVCVCVYHEW